MMRNIEKAVFWTNDDVLLYNAKHELLNQILCLDISFKAKGFFTINQNFFSAVSIISVFNIFLFSIVNLSCFV